MAYADKVFYRTEYIGRSCSDDTTLSKWLSRASDDIDIYTFNGVDVTALSDTALAMLKKATCAQAESYVVNGDDNEAFSSISIGSFSMTTKEDEAPRGASGLCANAVRYLTLTGLAFRGVPVCGRFRG